LDDVDDGVGGDRIAEVVAVVNLSAVDEGGHVIAQLALVVEDVAACAFVSLEVVFDDFTQGVAADFARWAGDVPLDVLREPYRGHGDVPYPVRPFRLDFTNIMVEGWFGLSRL